ncbi:MULTISPECIES: type IV pilin protein [unclassified Nitrospina]|uniref:type IV pilin protein n=1 Tax=unclassified Nitrospina TaxID=2638683 RepID=UPI003F97D986
MYSYRKRVFNQRGFTLIEVLITIAIVAVLAAIAIPQFTQYKERAYDSDSKSTLRHLFISCRVYWDDQGGTNTCDPAVAGNPAYGFIDPPDVTVNGSGDETSFSATAQHLSSSNTFTINNDGAIN